MSRGVDCTDLYPVNPVISRLKVQLGLEEDRVEQWLQDCIQARLALTEQSTSSTGTSVVKTYVAHMPKHSICCTFMVSCVVVVVVIF